MKKLDKAVIIISKIIEVASWIGCGFLAAMIIGAIVGHKELVFMLSDLSEETAEITIEGFSVGLLSENGEQMISALIVALLALLIILALNAMVFRNVNLIFKTTNGQTKFSQGKTPFQPANIRMVREIGIFLIAIPIVEFVLGMIATLITHGASEVSVGLGTLFMGLVVLALSQHFAYGMELQNDVDGLL